VKKKWLEPAQVATSADALGRLVRGHMPALDGLRGLAILLVLAHAFDVVDNGSGLDLALDLGWIGVQLFFVLSGFLITGILLDTQQSPHYFRNFWIRRVLRIFPLYYGVLFVAYAIVPVVASPPAGHGDHQIWLWTYTSNFAAPLGRAEPAFPHFWSLAVEEQFYLAWPLVVRLVGRRGVIALSYALVALAIATRVIVRARWGNDAAYTFTPCRMDALAIGAGAAALIRGDTLRRAIVRAQASALGAAGVAMVLGGAVLGHLLRTGAAMQSAGYTLIALGFAILLIAVLPVSGVPARVLSFAPLRRIGTYSYGMYVFHAPLHLFVGLPLLAHFSSGTAVGLLYACAATLATFVVAALSYHLYERRFLALKQVLAP
jgi:peptidoglycan/LPS O-acetylase OafA/YrhL